MKVKEVKSVEDAEMFCEGLVNDFQLGIIDRGGLMCGLRDYTFHLHDLFKANFEKGKFDLPDKGTK